MIGWMNDLLYFFCLTLPLLYCLIFTVCVVFLCFSGKYAQVTNNPENDGCINAVLLV